MGMGEPLLNYDSVVRAARILTDDTGLAFATRRITISTAGVVPRLRDLGRDLQTQLAISLNASSDAVRDQIMPINRKWPLGELLAALRHYPLPPRRRFTIEYVLLDGVNDRDEDARRLPELLRGLPVKVNLLPCNAHDRADYAAPPAERVERFQAILRRAGMNAMLRTARGREISAACGQLGGRGDGG
jgi:23S rRNA (adenine2503-C2)-methyltransferase